MTLESFYMGKEAAGQVKRQSTEWEKIFTNPTSDKGLLSRLYKQLKKKKKAEHQEHNPTKNGA